jgi:hypothetical protein
VDTWLEIRTNRGHFEHDNTSSGSIKIRECFDYLSDYEFLKQHCSVQGMKLCYHGVVTV